MALTNEDLLAISQLLDTKLKPIENRLSSIEMHLENITDRNVAILSENYMPAAKRYERDTERIESMQADIDIIKKVVAEHNEKLQMLT